MNIKMSIIALFLISIQCFSQTPAWLSAQNAGGTDGDWSYSVKTDANGNVYVAGSFKSATISFGTFTLNNTIAGSNDLFLVKYDNNQNVLWAVSYGGNGSDVASSVDVDETGNIYLGGYFTSASINFGGGVTVTRTGGSDILAVKLDSNGVAQWAKTAAGTANDEVEDINVDVFGNLNVVGYFESVNCTFGTITLNNQGHYDGFLVKYDVLGNVVSANGYGGAMWDNCKGIISDNAGNVYMTGFYRSDITFGDTTLINGTGDAHLFVAKYNSAGEYIWVKNSTGTWEVGNEIAVDNTNGVYVTGFFQGTTMSCDGLLLSNNGPSGVSDFFVVKYDQNGNPEWLTGGGNTDYEEGRGIDADDNGNVYVGAYFSSATITIGTTTITNNGAGDILVVKYQSDGSFSWVLNAGGDADDQVHSLSAGNDGRAFICGSFSSSSISFGNTTFINNGVADIFIAEAGDNFTGIQREMGKAEISVFPNPANQFITITSNPEMAGKGYFLTNAMGIIVCRGILTNESNSIDISDFSNGLYYLIIPENRGFNIKVIKF